MAKPIVLDQEWIERITTQVNGLEYGSVLITVHDGRVVQIDRTERKRFETSAKQNQNAKEQAGTQASAAGDKLKAIN
ncbi:hypothetical protein A8990_15410 [Paenibacillus taihuensis]|uniref:DUF2292 domain-containing protein n=1 Tax=Paenibacillus taihuensis TaxID=1156355 RepID=A0A3D9Q9D4_9BACL|nr:YezD family protein [Paenibacillus taihuensis]REE57464.1 hypothetical protein A8990_15410 [Paenibacillus taihuensis]